MSEAPLKAGQTWLGEDVLLPPKMTPMGYLRVARRAIPAILGIVLLLALLLVVRCFEKPLWGEKRPFTLKIKQWGCVWALFCMGIGITVQGRMMRSAGAVVCNHSGWIDIFAMGAAAEVTFVSKSEVAGWPGIGQLAKATGTLFVRRDPREATKQVALLQERFAAGQRLLFFPEGTSTDNQRVLPFKTTLFASFFAPEAKAIKVQPVSLKYTGPQGHDPRFYGWWGNVDFLPHLLMVLSVKKQGHVFVTFHDAVEISAVSGRKELAQACENQVRAGFEALSDMQLRNEIR